MRVFFKAQHPLFGKAAKPLSLAYQQRSPYYWWWAFLRRNEEYLECCSEGGKGALSALYADFVDVRDDSFKAWWTAGERGAVLFGEQPLPEKVQELHSAADWDSAWTKDRVMVVAVPLAISKRRMQGYFAKLLATRHGGKRGRKALSDSEASTALYPMHRSVSFEALSIQLAVYDAVTANKTAVKKKTLAQIGKELNLVRTAMPSPTDDVREAAYKRSVMAATVSRHYRDATRIIANTANGEFPNSK